MSKRMTKLQSRQAARGITDTAKDPSLDVTGEQATSTMVDESTQATPNGDGNHLAEDASQVTDRPATSVDHFDGATLDAPAGLSKTGGSQETSEKSPERGDAASIATANAVENDTSNLAADVLKLSLGDINGSADHPSAHVNGVEKEPPLPEASTMGSEFVSPSEQRVPVRFDDLPSPHTPTNGLVQPSLKESMFHDMRTKEDAVGGMGKEKSVSEDGKGAMGPEIEVIQG